MNLVGLGLIVVGIGQIAVAVFGLTLQSRRPINRKQTQTEVLGR